MLARAQFVKGGRMLGIVLAAMIAGCGFHLRGTANLPQESLYISGPAYSPFANDLKRAILAGICSATFLYWFNDKSMDHAATFAFLDRRLDEHGRFHGAMERLKEKVGKFPNPFMFAERLRPDRRRGRRGTL